MADGGGSEAAWLGLAQYQPREPFRRFHARPHRWAAMVCHRRAGKTVACVADLVCAAAFTKKQDARFAYVAPQFNQAKDIAWLYVKRLTVDIPGVAYNEGELRVDFPNGARVRLYGADNPDRLRGLYLDGVILDEYADMRPSVWGEVIRPLLADRQGWAVFIGTPKGRNEFFRIYDAATGDPAWFTMSLKASESGLIPRAELDAASKDMTPEQYAQEWECSFDAAILGAYYGRDIAEAERQGRIRAVPYDEAVPVHTAWDLGVGDSTAIWFFQVVGSEIHVVDYYENHGHGLPHYIGVLSARGYRYGTDFVPHDAAAREWGTGRTRIEQLLSFGRRPQIVPLHAVEDGINAARMTLPHAWFDAAKCADGIEALRQYRADYDEKVRAFKNNPFHDWTSHAADAFRYLAMAWREMRPPPPPPPKPKHLFEGRPDGTIVSNIPFRELVERQSKRRREDD